MAVILGVVAGFLGPALELGKCFAEPIKRQFSYLCCFNSNVQNLRDEARRLKDTRSGLQMKVDADKNNAQIVVPVVKTWLNDVDGIQAKNTEIEAEITTFRQNGCFAVKSRYSLGKKVKKTVEAMKGIREEGSKFTNIAQPPAPAAVAAPIPLGSNIFEFDSTKGIEEEIIVSLKDENVNKLGICGMGGVGKTTMAKRIMHRVREENLFDEIVMAVVSQKPDRLGIQSDIAKKLGLELKDEKSVECNAVDLHVRLTIGTKRSLIVLDDVWDVLDLEELGIPCNSGCKILLTSRDRDIMKRMDAEKVSAVRVLSETEAWDLFRSEAGSCIEQENVINVVAQQVVNECKGLPIALVTVGVALKDEADIRRWNHVLDQLKGANPNHMPEVIEAVYKPLRFSYESLASVNHKSLFLLCCLFPEDYSIHLEDLVIYATGLRMFRDVRSLEGARETVFFSVERLKSCFFLLEGESENHVKMHDVVRDVAIFIAADKRWINCDDCTWIAPYTEERLGLHMGSAVYPNLHLLLIDNSLRDEELEIGDDFFEGMEELNVLSITYSSLRRLPKTTKLMKNLKTLILDRCGSLESISKVGELVNLEILVCRGCNSIGCLPIEMAGISRLRLLELRGCWNLKTIAPGIISNQKGLEELIVDVFDNWEAVHEENRERKNASLSELEQLLRLSRLKIKIKDYRVAAGHKLPPNYDITIGDDNVMSLNVRGANKVTLPRNISLGKWIHECIMIVEYMRLERSNDSSLDFGAAHNMRSLTLEKCSAVKKLVNMRSSSATIFPLLKSLTLKELSKLEVICDIDGSMQSNSFQNLKELRLYRLPALKHLWNVGISPNQLNIITSFKMLSTIYISECHWLRSLFSCSVMARGSWFVQLESLEIWQCDRMEQVLLWNEEENQTNIHIPLVFPKLKKLKLCLLPRLTSFNKGIFQSIEFPLLEEMEVVHCPLQSFVFTAGSTRSPDDDDSRHLFGELYKVKLDSLKVLKLSGFESLKSLFSLSMTESSCLLQLEELEIEKCDVIEQILLWNGEENQRNNGITLQFPKLKLLKLAHMPMLTSFSKGFQSVEFPLLEEMDVWNCPLQSFVFTACSTWSPDDDDSGHLFGDLDKVKFGSLKIVQLKELDKGRNSNNCSQFPIDFFDELRKLKLSRFKSLKSLFSLSMTESGCLLQLQELEIWGCDMMEQVLLWNEEENQTNIHIPLVFPKLKKLKLCLLPRLTSFSKGIFQSIEFPLLEEMEVVHCPLQSFVFTACSTRSPDDDDSRHLFGELDKVKFGSLKVLKLSGFKCLKSLFSLSVTERSCLLRLEELEVEECDMMEQVLRWNGEENQRNNGITLQFPKLKLLNLSHMPTLTSFGRGIFKSIEFPLLEEMKVWNCPLLKVEFGNLKELRISNYDSVRNWCGQISIDFFAVLCKLEVSSLNGMKSLFLSSIARNLLNLVELVIFYCEEMIKVIEDEEDDALQISLFPNLKRVELLYLKKLKCFCEWRCTLQLLKLEYLVILNCDVMDEFTLGDLNTPNLKTIEIDWHDYNGNEVKKALQQHRLKRESQF